MKKTFTLFVAATMLLAQTAGNPFLQRQGEKDLPVIHTQKNFSTLIEFPADQKIAEVTCGDKEFWVIEGSGRFLHVKPAKEGIVTNLNVLMEGDIVYAFILREVTRAGTAKENADLRVSINPGEDPAKLRERLDASVRESTSLKESLAQSQQALVAMNEKYLAEKVKKELNSTMDQMEYACRMKLPLCSTSAPVSSGQSAPAGSVAVEPCTPSPVNDCQVPAAATQKTAPRVKPRYLPQRR